MISVALLSGTFKGILFFSLPHFFILRKPVTSAIRTANQCIMHTRVATLKRRSRFARAATFLLRVYALDPSFEEACFAGRVGNLAHI